MNDGPDAGSPATQRRMWRRVWISLALFVIVSPILLWIAIDHAGKLAWQRAQKELHAKGEAATIDDLGLFSRAQAAEGNFCLLPWLTANDDGTASAAMEDFEATLAAYGGAVQQPLLLQTARGEPALGIARDFEALAEMLDLVAEEKGLSVDEPRMLEAKGDAVARIRVHLRPLERYCREAEAVRDQPQAVWLPTIAERAGLHEANPSAIEFPTLNPALSFSKALAFRAAAALQVEDYETALRSLEVSMRLAEACVNEFVLIGGIVAMTIHSTQLNVVVECLWEEGIQNNPAHLARLQKILQSWEMIEIVGRMVRGETAYGSQIIVWAANHRALARELYSPKYFGADIGLFLRFAPDGWFFHNAAYSATVIDETLLQGIRNGRLSDVLAESARLDNRIDSANRQQRFMQAFSNMTLPVYGGTVDRSIYPEALRRQAVIVCAIHRYRMDHDGNFPDQLNLLVPRYLETLPLDPIDDLPMRYTINTSKDFLLYSIGFDGKDDGSTLTLDLEDPIRSKVYHDDYIGDWPWPVDPQKIDKRENSAED